MKILFVDIGDAESSLNWSGTTSRILEQFRRSHDVVLLHKLNKLVKYAYAPHVAECKLRGVKLQLDRHEWVARSYARQVKKAYDYHKPDVIFSVSSIPLAYLPAGIPTAIWTDAIMRDMVEFYWSSAAFHKGSLDAGLRLDELSLQNNNASIFSSTWAADGARNFSPESSDRIFHVSFGANTVAAPPPEGAKSMSSDPSAPINFLFVGVDWKRKGGQDAVDALKILRAEGYNVHLSIVGARPLLDSACTEFVHQYGFLNRDVEVERTTLQHLHAAAHFFILPTHAETAGIVFAEAASHGLPVITRDVGGVSSMVNRNKNCILIDPSHGPELLADAVRPLLSEPERYKTMSEASLQLFANRLNWDTAAAQVFRILEEMKK